MLQGFDEQWVFPQSGQRTATYTSLPPGHYRFLIRACNNSGVWIEKPVAVNVIVHPPFWQTWWFIAAMALLLLSGTVLIVRYYAQRRLKERLRRLELQRRLQEERERISRDLHDNVGAQLTYIIHTLDNIAYKLPEQGTTGGAERIGDLGSFARETMAQLRETIWALHRDNVSLEELRNKLQEHASRLLTISGRGECQIRTEGEPLILQPTQAVNLFRIVQEAVNNSLKHASAERIEVVFRHENQTLTVTVRDNGKGFDTAAQYDGHYGLGNMESRAREIGAAFEISSKPGETLITLVLPLA
jgi:signal transduction histidine kinase